MHRLTPRAALALLLAATTPACGGQAGTPAPAEGWANVAPAVVLQAVDLGEHQLLEVSESQWRFWAQVPDVGARAGDHVLLGKGSERYDVAVHALGARLPAVVDIAHVRVVDAETAQALLAQARPPQAVPIAEVFARRATLHGTEVVVHGSVVKVSNGIVGSNWVHLQDGSGSAAAGDHDLLVQTAARLEPGQRLALKGRLVSDADLGFGYQYDALLEQATPLP